MKDKFMMDNHKLMWHLDRVNDWSLSKKISPLHIDFGITTGCNMACKYCYGMIQARTNTAKRFDMPQKAIFRFFKDAKEIGVRSIAIIGEGENTLNEALYDSANYAKKIDLDISLATNGIALKKERLKDLLESLKWIRFNISAAFKESYVNVHNVSSKDFNSVLENIKECVRIKKTHGLNVTIGLQMVVIKSNFQDIVPLAELGKDLGVDYLVIKPCSDTPDKRLNVPTTEYLNIENMFKKAEGFSDENYTVSVKWSKFLNKGEKKYNTCYGTQFILGISGNGNVFPCGHWFNIRKDDFLMGNIIDASLKDIVAGERYWQVQKRIQTVNVNSECETNCRQHYINEFLFKIKHSKPQHINFI